MPVPSGIDLAQATAMILDWNTAYGMVVHAARVKVGLRVFVHGLSGAVGRALLTLAKIQGAEVFGTASPRNHPALIELGAAPYPYSDKGGSARCKALAESMPSLTPSALRASTSLTPFCGMEAC